MLCNISDSLVIKTLKPNYHFEVNHCISCSFWSFIFSSKLALMFKVLSPYKVTQVINLSYFTIMYLNHIYLMVSPTLRTSHSTSAAFNFKCPGKKTSYFTPEAKLIYSFPPSSILWGYFISAGSNYRFMFVSLLVTG